MATDPFRTRDHVPDFDEKVLEYRRLSAETRSELQVIGDLPYGPAPGQRLDIFIPSDGRDHGNVGRLPVHIFIHGGYWRMFSKDDFSYIARTVVDAGAIAVLLDYDLMPSVRLADVVRQVRDAKAWVAENIARYGGNASRLTVSGHSAGAHLATFLFTEGEESPPRGALLLGGIYNIRPLRESFLQPLIQLTDDEVRQFSPIDDAFQPRVNSVILYGERETKPFHTQAGGLAWQLKRAGCEVSLSALPGADHMSSVLDLGFSDTEAGRHLSSLIARH
ncbi:alpha/beta hydrolase [Mesorhizobium sp. ASY16-5R]|uniref:alpha/beta hydrolase n=1 Tax=Mesorhizobium sp. ASY16-5R TaxID=3445772 RepID=UPI003F9EEA02